MKGMGKRAEGDRGRGGFTLIEVIVVIAILGILAAVLLPSVTSFLGRGDEAAFESDVKASDTAVAEFKLDRHQGPNATPEWGAGTGNEQRLYPTRDGLAPSIELNPDTSVSDASFPANLRVHVFAAGPTVGATVTDGNVTNALVWFGLLVNDALTQSGAAQQTTGNARPRTGEDAQYLPAFPKSAHAENTTKNGGGQHTTGTYRYVVLQNGKVAALYKSGGLWYAGFNTVYP